MTENEKIGNSELFQKPVHRLLRRCCGACANINQVRVLNTIKDLNTSEISDSDFIYPVFSKASKERMYGYYYLPLIEIPGLMYASEPPKRSLLNLLSNVFPICMVSLLLCVVAGFICWLLEYQENEEEFPRGFLVGWYEGSWWAFVSMTTVRCFFILIITGRLIIYRSLRC